MKSPDLVGQTFGRLLVIAPSGTHVARGGNTQKLWRCHCECGGSTVATTTRLRRGVTKSCGCWRRERLAQITRTHGESGTSTYQAWANMRDRCGNNKSQSYRMYGARGIFVCERWNTFENFKADMGVRPSSSHSIDRIDNAGPYSPDNCRWATPLEQHNNTRANRRLSHKGRSLTISQWAREFHIKRDTLDKRLRSGWSIGRALTQPVRQRRNSRERTL